MLKSSEYSNNLAIKKKDQNNTANTSKNIKQTLFIISISDDFFLDILGSFLSINNDLHIKIKLIVKNDLLNFLKKDQKILKNNNIFIFLDNIDNSLGSYLLKNSLNKQTIFIHYNTACCSGKLQQANNNLSNFSQCLNFMIGHYINYHDFSKKNFKSHIYFLINNLYNLYSNKSNNKSPTNPVSDYVNLQKPLKKHNDHDHDIQSKKSCSFLAYKFHISSSKSKDIINDFILKSLKKLKLRQHLCKSIYSINEELITNALYDATSKTTNSYDIINKKQDIFLDKMHWPLLKSNFNKKFYIISITDYIGAFDFECFIKHIKKSLHRDKIKDFIEQKSQGGAGLGIFKIILIADCFMVFRKKNCYTEAIAIVFIENNKKKPPKIPKTFHYFDL